VTTQGAAETGVRDEFTSFLKEHRDDRICTVTPGGNHGDTLIHMGLVKVLDSLGVEYTCLNLKEVYGERPTVALKYLVNIAAWRTGLNLGFGLLDIPEDADLILFEGGGYMNDIWYGPVLLRQVLRRHRKPVAVAPQSYAFRGTDFMGMLPRDRSVTLFSRERYSLEHLSEMTRPPNVRLKLSQDTALYLQEGDLTPLVEPYGESYDLVSFREDKESLVPEREKAAVKKACENPRIEDVSVRGSLSDFVSAVADARRIYTDRLHVSILAHILGKEVTLYGNRYHKNKGVYERSLSGDPKVVFVEV
jgi:exopolysaccharide biosynthesis predicted pyruvyltransferase EpsI